MNSEEGDEEVFHCTPPEIRALATNSLSNLLPTKSRQIYEKKYSEFENWCKENNISTISENVLMAYFEVQRQKYKSSSLWCLYSQLKSCIGIHNNVDISKYHKLQALLKRCSEGYVPKKSKILEEYEINKFISEADDTIYLAMKVSTY
ncbi:hypothetical protein Zmor_022406 [Zophobas morio]|uniref:Uncharacterized protein n=1 Tax=Zophobas morio TaxID=2755281 RepID=A0AA38HXP3_9CUCU|nr:hypothetical protein Zmor_022406 [Zophobas morio]